MESIKIKKALFLFVNFVSLILVYFCIQVVNVNASTSTAKIHFITADNYQDAILLESNGKFAMIDAGEDTDYPDGSDSRYPFRDGITTNNGHEIEVIDYMKSVGVTTENFEFFLGTHPHSDHIGAADEIIREFHPKRVYLMEYKDEYVDYLWDNLYVYDRVIEAANEVGAVLIQNFNTDAPLVPDSNEKYTVSRGYSNTLEDSIEVLSPEEIKSNFEIDIEEEDIASREKLSESENVTAYNSEIGPNDILFSQNPETTANPNFQFEEFYVEIMNYTDDYKSPDMHKNDANLFSLGVKLTCDNKTAFLAGDIVNIDGDEDKLAELLGHIDFLKLGHHGSNGANTDNFLQTLSPTITVLTGKYSYLNEQRLASIESLHNLNGCLVYPVASYYKEVPAIIFDFKDETICSDLPENLSVLGQDSISEKWIALRNGWRYGQSTMAYYMNKPYLTDQNGYLASEQWVEIHGERYYATKDGSPITSGFHNIGGNIYYFDDNYIMLTGRKKIDNYIYTFDENGKLISPLKDGWTKIDNYWYYYEDGKPKNGWLKKGKNYYYIVNGIMQTEWQKISNKWYYFGKTDDGVMKIGWQKISDKWYYFGKINDGSMKIGWQKISNKWYYLNSSGVMQTGWQEISSKWYYLDNSGVMQTGWQKISNKWYYLDENGVMQTGWRKVSNKWYYLNSSGVMQIGWQKISNKWYYLDENGVMQTSWQKVSNKWYYLDENGVMQTGWRKVSNKWYYLNSSGVMQIGWCMINKNYYYFETSGIMKEETKWIKINGSWYYMTVNHTRYHGWLTENKNKYYLDPKTGVMTVGWCNIADSVYYFNSAGVMQIGWYKENNNMYYFDKNGKRVTGIIEIEGKKYYFDENGVLLDKL